MAQQNGKQRELPLLAHRWCRDVNGACPCHFAITLSDFYEIGRHLAMRWINFCVQLQEGVRRLFRIPFDNDLHVQPPHFMHISRRCFSELCQVEAEFSTFGIECERRLVRMVEGQFDSINVTSSLATE